MSTSALAPAPASVYTACQRVHPVRKLKCMRHTSDPCGMWHVSDLGAGFQFRWRLGIPDHDPDWCHCVLPNSAGGIYKSLKSEFGNPTR